MTPLAQGWLDGLQGTRPTIALADGEDERVRRAAVVLADLGVCPVLLTEGSAAPATGVEVQPVKELAAGPVGDEVEQLLLDAGKPGDVATAARRDPVHLATCLTRRGDADATVAGASRPTSDVLRAGLHVLGLADGVSTLTSSFLLDLPDGRTLCFADCGVVPVPTVEQLADIVRSSATTFRRLVAQEPVVALLSFSTKGSARHPSLDRLREARELVNASDPELAVDDELQFDAALVPEVGSAKAPGSPVAGRANVLVFPDLASGNIGYKIAERLGGAHAYGPLLQGLAGSLNDLSRGCSPDDVVNVALISAVQARQ